MVPPKIVGGDKYSWSCYGDNARYLDMENNVDVIFDEKTQEVYEICIRGDSEDGADSDIVWRSPICESDYLLELKEKMTSPIIFDGRNIYDAKLIRGSGFEYHGIGLR